MKMRRTGIVLGVLAVAACGDSVAGMADLMADAGRALEDAGQAVADAGAALADAGRGADGSARAEAPSAQEVACDKTYTQTATSGSTTIVQTWWFAETPIDGHPPVDVVLCGKELLGQSLDTYACPHGYACTGGTAPADDCSAALVTYDSTTVRVLCGSRTVASQGDLVQTDYGQRHKNATFTVR